MYPSGLRNQAYCITSMPFRSYISKVSLYNGLSKGGPDNVVVESMVVDPDVKIDSMDFVRWPSLGPLFQETHLSVVPILKFPFLALLCQDTGTRYRRCYIREPGSG